MIINDKENYNDMMAKLIGELGFTDIKKGSNESAVSMTAVKDGKTYVFGCKYDIDAITGTVMEEFISAVSKANADEMVFMTNSSFSSSAKKAADAAGVQLWDRNHIDRISIGVDTRLEEPQVRQEHHRVIYVVAAIVAVILIAAVVLYFNPSLLPFLK